MFDINAGSQTSESKYNGYFLAYNPNLRSKIRNSYVWTRKVRKHEPMKIDVVTRFPFAVLFNLFGEGEKVARSKRE